MAHASFIYVAGGTRGFAKIGVSANPNARLAQLQTASPFPVSLAYLATCDSDGYAVEQVGHRMLFKRRLRGEWFDCPAEMAIGAIHAAAARLNERVLAVDPACIKRVAPWRPWGHTKNQSWKLGCSSVAGYFVGFG